MVEIAAEILLYLCFCTNFCIREDIWVLTKKLRLYVGVELFWDAGQIEMLKKNVV